MDFLDRDLFGLLNWYQLLIIIHLFGLALGAGAAFFSDFLFTHIIREKKISKEQFAILKLASKVVWLGLIVLVVSGATIFLFDTERLLDSPKFLAKMSIIFILLINGVIFEYKHLPLLKKCVGKDLRRNKLFAKESGKLFTSGAISGVSWASALILGAFPFIDYSYFAIMAIYIALIVPAVVGGMAIRKVLLR